MESGVEGLIVVLGPKGFIFVDFRFRGSSHKVSFARSIPEAQALLVKKRTSRNYSATITQELTGAPGAVV